MYAEKDRMDNFSNIVDHFNRQKINYDKGFKVSRPIKKFSSYYNDFCGYFGVTIEVTCNNYNDNLKRIEHYRTSYSVDLIITEDGTYVPKDVPQNIKEFVTDEAIKKSMEYAFSVFGPHYEAKFEGFRNKRVCEKTIKKYTL